MKSLKTTAFIVIALAATGCASNPIVSTTSSSDIDSLRQDIADLKQRVEQANDNAMAARREAQENSRKINETFRRNLRK